MTDQEKAALGAATKRVYWIVRNETENLRDRGQDREADLTNEAWELIVKHLKAHSPT